MKKTIISLSLLLATGITANAQLVKKINANKAIGAAEKGVKAATFSDAEAARTAAEAVNWMDEHNPVAGPKDPYTTRLNKIFAKHKNEDGLNLNYKVYKVTDINAFACADGSVRVFSALMDMMTDDELLAVVGHEIGHVANHDSRDAMRAAYKRAAINDAVSSTGSVATALTESQLGALAEAMMDAKYSRKQETAADEYSYRLLKKYNYNVMAEISAFEKLAALSEGAQQSKTEKMLSSHPDSGKRAEHIADMAKKDGLYKEQAATPAGGKKKG